MKLVMDATSAARGEATEKLNGWYRKIGRDALALARIVADAQPEALNADNFERSIDRAIEAFVIERDRGPQFLLVTPIKTGG